MAKHLLHSTDIAGRFQTDRRSPVSKIVSTPFAAKACLNPFVDRGRMNMTAEAPREVVRFGPLLYLELVEQ